MWVPVYVYTDVLVANCRMSLICSSLDCLDGKIDPIENLKPRFFETSRDDPHFWATWMEHQVISIYRIFGMNDAKGEQLYNHPGVTDTVDGQNPAPPRMMNIPLFIGFSPSQVVQDFFHQQISRFYDSFFFCPGPVFHAWRLSLGLWESGSQIGRRLDTCERHLRW